MSNPTNGLAKSWHQFLQTTMLTGALGLGAWCWHLLTDNSNRLIRVEERQLNVLGRLAAVESNVLDLNNDKVHQNDRLDFLEGKPTRQKP